MLIPEREDRLAIALDACDLREALATGALAAEAVAADRLARIAARDGEVRAWAHVDPAAVLAQARALDEAQTRGRLHGVPIGVKDVIQTRDMPTRYNSPLHAEPEPTPDAAAVAMLREAGALILGKTATVEFAAIGEPAATRNPHDLARTPGGSSSGSAAAAADGHVPLALGTQTGGSMIRPASFCGAWAMKPTWGRVSNEGCKRFAPSLDTLGWFGASARDLGLLLDVLDPSRDPPPAPPSSALRIAVCRTPMWEHAEASTHAAMDQAVAALRQAGVEVTMLTLPEMFSPLPDLQRVVMRAEGRVSFQPERTRLTGRMREMAEGVDVVSDAELAEALDEAASARSAFDRIAADFDAVLAPSVPGEAPLGLASTGDLIFNGFWTLLHTPCVNIPAWRGETGLPVGLTLTGGRYTDRRVLAVAEAIRWDASPG